MKGISRDLFLLTLDIESIKFKVSLIIEDLEEQGNKEDLIKELEGIEQTQDIVLKALKKLKKGIK